MAKYEDGRTNYFEKKQA